MGPDIGLQLPCRLPPSRLVALARDAEHAGFDEVWIVEDCFYAGGVATAASVLAATERVVVGIGILPTVVRNAAFTAMELAALADLHPRRLIAGLGHGMRDWMRQVGAAPASPLTALAEHLDAVRALLAGETVTVQGRYVRLDGVRLEFPPEAVPPVLAGVRGPKSLEVSGRHADGTLLAEPASPAYITAARRAIAEGHTDPRRPHRLAAYTWFHVGEDLDEARDALRPAIAAAVTDPAWAAHLEPLGYAGQARELADLPEEERAGALPDAWIDELAVVGTPRDCAARIGELYRAGADAVVLLPGPDTAGQLARAGADLLPLLRS
ncbi:LLM class flavin-dependent oxidoreductase [Marinactinospora thermotolerans]|uniref:Flavin-dependent oxidoreductase, luciferase family (Includes alkanesulfonate monooxygenase SsuD and methylene tetrahydromethanopterin reductase) n=1 Tax=Marinactinospora thermotolerans DSM 45154 TaxID=1122192 RepID=A0A1T4QDA4_9ACTN|nr:LLM class flavin-dependent oxidoreductase [Marinactinospora thermotolerans]SKA01675.1 Flavin-dependent oxidoreductase, luciferase family (includes alkanesulfonate monooxygenase SsuD and methylene tetrahydromethanopterin reductase) [Marinactinospora thermotolerans DSM 45154]